MGVGKHVVYFALLPPAEVAERVRALVEGARRSHGLTARAVPADRLHIALNAVGSFRRPPEPIVRKALELGAAVRARPFSVAFDRMGTWTSGAPPWPLVLHGDEGTLGVEALYAAIHQVLARPGMVPRRLTEIAPHMTLVCDRAEIPDSCVEPVSWTADEFVLVHTAPGEGRYDVVGRFALSG